MTVPAEDALAKMRRELERLEEDCTLSGKAHFNASDRWGRYHFWLGIPAVVLSAVAGAAFLKTLPEIASALSTAAAVLTGIITFVKPSEKSAAHKTWGDQYLSLRNNARILRELGLDQLADEKTALDQLAAMSAKRDELNQGAAQFSRQDFEKARAGVDQGESTHVVDGGGPNVRA